LEDTRSTARSVISQSPDRLIAKSRKSDAVSVSSKLRTDFPNEVDDKQSVMSGFKSEANEWDAIHKYQLLQDF
jgi:hypothetical protein